MRTRIAICAVCIGAVAGCGGSSSTTSSIQSKSPDAILAAAQAATVNTKSVHVAGSFLSNGTQITIDFELVAGKGGQGQLTRDGFTLRLVRIGQDLYGNANLAFWRHVASETVAQAVAGKWLKLPASTGDWASIAALLDQRKMFSQLSSHHGKIGKGPLTTVAGRQVVPLEDKAGVLYVAATGKPYPVELLKLGPDHGRLVFDRFDTPVSLTAPPNAVPAGG